MLQLMILNDPTPPAVGSQEFLQYSGLIGNLGIFSWENERGVLWQELMVPVSNGGTIATGITTISLPDDFKFMYGGIVTLTYTSGSQLSFKLKTQAEQLLNPYNQVREFYVTGNPSEGYNLVLGWIPIATDPEIGATISYQYYKVANQPTYDTQGNITDLSDIPEMSDPRFIVYTVAQQIQAGNYNDAMADRMQNLATYSLTTMRQANELPANYEDNYVKDADYLLRHQGYKRNPHISPNGSYSN